MLRMEKPLRNSLSISGAFSGFSRLKLFGALSRTPHGLIDMSAPMLAALVWHGGFPSWRVILLGLITVFAGYTAVYALNDVVDYREDREKARLGAFEPSGSDLDAVLIRHPMAQGFLSFNEGLIWAMAWGAVAFIGAYLLNPVCMLIFVIASALEVIYCLMLRVSYLRVLVSGAVKSAGALAAVFAVDPSPSPLFLVVLFAWLFLWEIGGQNVPNDWTDLDADRRQGARTIPVAFGAKASARIILATLSGAIALNAALMALSPAGFSGAVIAMAAGVGLCLLLIPALRLHFRPAPARAMALFNSASYYPLTLFILVLINILFL